MDAGRAHRPGPGLVLRRHDPAGRAGLPRRRRRAGARGQAGREQEVRPDRGRRGWRAAHAASPLLLKIGMTPNAETLAAGLRFRAGHVRPRPAAADPRRPHPASSACSGSSRRPQQFVGLGGGGAAPGGPQGFGGPPRAASVARSSRAVRPAGEGQHGQPGGYGQPGTAAGPGYGQQPGSRVTASRRIRPAGRAQPVQRRVPAAVERGLPAAGPAAAAGRVRPAGQPPTATRSSRVSRRRAGASRRASRVRRAAGSASPASRRSSSGELVDRFVPRSPFGSGARCI